MYIARQPIFKTNKEVFAYELLFRAEKESSRYDGISPIHSTASILAGLFESGISEIIDDRKAFINFDSALLKTDTIELIDKDVLVIEVLEDVVIDDILIDRLKDLQSKGYKIALDDFISSIDTYPLVEYAQIIKYDITLTPLNQIADSINAALNKGKILLAEKVETEEDFQEAKKMGFTLFQGYFFSKPIVVDIKNDKNTTTNSQYIRILRELKSEDTSFQNIAEIVKTDAKLAYKLMRIVSDRSDNVTINSIRRALTYIGLKELERWINILMIQDLGGGKPQELIYISLIRSRFCELIATSINMRKDRDDAAIMGLFSTIDALLDIELDRAIEKISISEKISDALLHSKGELASILSLVKAYEVADWDKIDEISESIGLAHEKIYKLYSDSVSHASSIMSMI